MKNYFVSTIITILLLPMLVACPDSGKIHGNAEGYGIINVTVVSNKSKTFSLIPEGKELVQGSLFFLESNPEHGKLDGFPASGGQRLVASSDAKAAQATFTPAANYEGFDTFSYTIRYPDGREEPIKAFVDVLPCLREPTKRSMSDNIYIVSAKRAAAENKTIDVNVANIGKPMVLYLGSGMDTIWNLKLEAGAEIEKVVVLFPYSIGNPPQPSVVGVDDSKVTKKEVNYPTANQWEVKGTHDVTEFRDFIEPIRESENKNETSFQGCDSANSFRVPFSPDSLATSCPYKISRYVYGLQDCKDKCRDVVAGPYTHTRWMTNVERFGGEEPAEETNANLTWGSPGLSGNGLTTYGRPGLTLGSVRTNLAKSCGKQYFELLIQDIGNGGFGLYPTLPDWMYNTSPLESFSRRPSFSSANLSPGDVVGIALDLDNGVISYSRNGVWLNGSVPSEGKGLDLGLVTYEPMAIELSLSEIMRLRANFGSEAFVHAIPAGFDAGFTSSLLTGQPPDLKPQALDKPVLIIPGQAYTGTLRGIANNGGALTYEITQGATKGVLTLTNVSAGAFSYVPGSSFLRGIEEVRYVVHEDEKVSTEARLLIEVAPASTLPSPASAQAEVHYVGVYNGMEQGLQYPQLNGVAGTMRVEVTRTGKPIILVLAANSGVEWEIVKSADVTLEQVIIGGYDHQRIKSIPDGVPLHVATYQQGTSAAFTYFHAYAQDCSSGGGSNYWASTKSILSDLLGVGITSAQGAEFGAPLVVGPTSNADRLPLSSYCHTY